MTYYICEPDWESMLSCIYQAWADKKGHQNIHLQAESPAQFTLFDEYIHVKADSSKAEKVISSIRKKISSWFYEEMAYLSLAYESDTLDTIYRCIILGFAFGSDVLNQIQYKDIMRYQEIRTRLGREVHRFQEFLRFHRLRHPSEATESIYVAHFEPKSRISLALGPIFQDRMPSEHWMILDDVHQEAVIHPKDEPFFMRIFSDEEFQRLLETEKINDEYTQLWKTFFRSVCIEERKNGSLQQSMFPLWTRKHVVEFMSD